MFNPDAVLQSLDLNEAIVQAVYKRSGHQYRYRLQQQEFMTSLAADDPMTSSRESLSTDSLDEDVTSRDVIPAVGKTTILDGCLIITEQRVYECRPRCSPERLFLDICMKQQGVGQSEQLGIMLGLDVNYLYDLMAEYTLSAGRYGHAMRFYQLSKVGEARLTKAGIFK